MEFKAKALPRLFVLENYFVILIMNFLAIILFNMVK